MRRYANILLALLALACTLYYGVRLFTLPYYGISVDARGIVRDAREGSVVSVGDRLISINGRALRSAGGLQAAERELERGEPVLLQVQRGALTFQAVQRPLRLGSHIVAAQVAASVLALLFIAIGVLVALRPTGKPGQLFFLFSIAIAVLLGYTGYGGVVETVVLTACGLFAPAFLLHFFLLFPHRHPLAERFHWLEWSQYWPPAVFLLLLAGLEVATRVSVVPIVLVETLAKGSTLFQLAYLLWAVLTFVDSYRRLADPLEKEKLRWLVWGVAISILPNVVMIGLGDVLRVDVPYFEFMSPLVLAFLPLSFGYAILSHRLMDIEVVLNRGLVYSVVTVILLVIFIVVENLLAVLSLELTGRSSFALAMGAAVIMAALVSPVKRRIQLFIDRLFFAYKARLREGLRDLSEELSFITDLERMEHVLVRRLTALAHVWSSALFLREDGGEGYVLTEFSGNGAASRGDGAGAGGNPRQGPGQALTPGQRFDANDSLIVWLLREARPLSLESLPDAEFHQRVEARELEILKGMEAALCLPLRLRGDLMGFILLSRRRNRELFNRDEIDLLHNLAIKAAADLTNARLPTRSRRLEEEVSTLRDELLAGLRGFLASSGGAGRDAGR
jgi:GAF domain-containing protein